MGPADEARLKQWLPAHFQRVGIAGERIRKLIVLPLQEEGGDGIVLLTGTEDEAAANAITVRSGKSNRSKWGPGTRGPVLRGAG